MAKKFVRGITDIKTINNQDFDTNSINDLLSDGEHNYIHRKKGTAEEYHNLTDNLKTVLSDDTDLLDVTNDNDTSNSATLHPKHDSQKEQALESERDTITIVHAENGTSETTKVDTNPAVVLEHDNLLTGYGIGKTNSGNTTTLGVDYTKVADGFDLNSLTSGSIRGVNLTNAPSTDLFFVETSSEGSSSFQKATALSVPNTQYVRVKTNDSWGEWRERVGDKSAINTLLAQKQNIILNNGSIAPVGDGGLRQLYTFKQSYNTTNGLLKTHIKSISRSSTPTIVEDEFNFIVKINKGATSVVFTISDNDQRKFTNIMSAYGQDNSVRISGCTFTLSGSSLTVSTPNNVDNNYVITFSDII